MSLTQVYYYTKPDDQEKPKTAECYEWEARFAEQAEKNAKAKRKKRRRKRKR